MAESDLIPLIQEMLIEMRQQRRESAEQSGALNQRIDNLTGRIDNLTGRIDSLTGRIDNLTGRIDSLTGKIDLLVDQIAVLAGEVGRVSQRVDTILGIYQTSDRLARIIENLLENQRA
jgi:chromosome segregation ATPase